MNWYKKARIQPEEARMEADYESMAIDISDEISYGNLIPISTNKAIEIGYSLEKDPQEFISFMVDNIERGLSTEYPQRVVHNVIDKILTQHLEKAGYQNVDVLDIIEKRL